MRAEVDLRHFRAMHGIQEQAVYPDSLLWHVGVIAVLALSETLVNAVFYENAQGLLGGFVVALSVSAAHAAEADVPPEPAPEDPGLDDGGGDWGGSDFDIGGDF